MKTVIDDLDAQGELDASAAEVFTVPADLRVVGELDASAALEPEDELRAAWAALGLAIKRAALRDAVRIRRAWRRFRT